MNLLSHSEKLLSLEDRIVSGYLTMPIHNNKGFKIAIDINGYTCVLINEILFEEIEWTKSNYKLENLELEFNVDCNIRDVESASETSGKFTIIKLINANQRMREYFLRIMEGVILKISSSPKIATLSTEIDYLVDLFARKTKVTEAVLLGLWGELFYIKQSSNLEEALVAWHSEINKTFDFSFKDGFVEVKTTTKPSRIHTFNNNQLIDFKELTVGVISILTEKSYHGKSIQNLWDDISKHISNIDLKTKLSHIIAMTIGDNVDEMEEARFNDKLAASTLKLFSSNNVPHIELDHIDDRVISVKIDVDLS